MYLDKVAIPSFILNREVLTGVLSAGSLFLVTPVPESFFSPTLNFTVLKQPSGPRTSCQRLLNTTIISLSQDLYSK